MKSLATIAAISLLAVPAWAQDQNAGTDQAVTSPGDARAVFLDTNGDSIGTATLVKTPNGVLIRAELTNLPAGPHGFHIHETGACDASGGFQSSGGHFNPGDRQHGYMVDGGPHAGDLPNQTVGDDGHLMAQVFAPMVTLAEGDSALLDDDGAALVIHSTADDYMSQPSGGAGDRIACGVIEL